MVVPPFECSVYLPSVGITSLIYNSSLLDIYPQFELKMRGRWQIGFNILLTQLFRSPFWLKALSSLFRVSVRENLTFLKFPGSWIGGIIWQIVGGQNMGERERKGMDLVRHPCSLPWSGDCCATGWVEMLGVCRPVCDDTQNLNETKSESFFRYQIFSDTESHTFFDTK